MFSEYELDTEMKGNAGEEAVTRLLCMESGKLKLWTIFSFLQSVINVALVLIFPVKENGKLFSLRVTFDGLEA